MSTKNLARTILERGRPGPSKYSRRLRHRQSRREIKNYLHKCKLDPEYYFDHKEIGIIRDSFIGVELSDNLMPVYRFLDSRVGKSWAETGKIIKEKFDARTLAGYHIVHTHILGEIGGIGMQETYHPSVSNRIYLNFSYFVENNILKKVQNKQIHSNYIITEKEIIEPTVSREEVEEFLNHRKIGIVDGLYYWFENPHAKYRLRLQWYYNISYGFTYSEFMYDWNRGLNFRRTRKLDREEYNIFINFPSKIKESILKGIK